MADVVRDLVVSLSLDAGEFTRNMRAISWTGGNATSVSVTPRWVSL